MHSNRHPSRRPGEGYPSAVVAHRQPETASKTSLPALAAALLLAMVAPALAADGKLVWQDEFDRGTLDARNWSPCPRGPSDWNRKMSNAPGLIEVRDGLLRLHGVVNPDRSKDPSDYLTAGVTSTGKFQFHRGRIEVRARFKSAQGAWPAIWLLASDVRWPSGGEVDLMEHLNFDDFVHHSVHTPHTLDPRTPRPAGNSRTAKVDRDAFNVYGLDWTDDRMQFLINGAKTFAYPRDATTGPFQWPFQVPMHVKLSMQIGGKWVGEPNPLHYPAFMEIDWVRVYAPE